MPLTQRFDRLLLGAAILQTTVGLAILASASWAISTERYGRPGSYFVTWQTATAVVGLGVMVLVMHVKVDLLGDRRLLAVAVGASWLLLAAAYLQPPVAATHRWLSIGGLSLQPSVLARLAVVAWAAVELDTARTEGWPLRRLVSVGVIAVVTAALVVTEPDLGSAALLAAILSVMAFVAGVPVRLLAMPVVAVAVALVVAVVTSPYRLARVRAFLDPDSVTAAAWQSTQSLVAIGSGGLLGRGYGAGQQKLFFLPEPHTDFIFAITGEELGLAGMVVLLALAAVVTWRGMVIASKLETARRGLLAFGLAFAFGLQSLVHVAVCLNLLPPKGIPLPLVSYGKTDLLVSLASIGLLLNLSREARS
jgi:cell division protein FtsW